jgi:2-keto-4-pentenoate hydratase/2-oxohepta-3-ene-1,7-dioic acid hydratase in catechol pathway
MNARYCRVKVNGQPTYAVVEGEWLSLLDGAPWQANRPKVTPIPLVGVELLVPCEPTKIVCIGQNYRKHAEELGKSVPTEPLIFLKPPSALNAHGRPIRLPPQSQEVHHEAELGLVIGKPIYRASVAEAREAIFGLTIVNDVTARDIQRREVQHTRAKGFDTFCCVGPWLQTGLSWDDLGITCKVSGQLRQQGRTRDQVFPPAQLVSFISQGMTLLPGDLISTGTPAGVGPIKAGDKVEIEIEGIGALSNPVESLET